MQMNHAWKLMKATFSHLIRSNRLNAMSTVAEVLVVPSSIVEGRWFIKLVSMFASWAWFWLAIMDCSTIMIMTCSNAVAIYNLVHLDWLIRCFCKEICEHQCSVIDVLCVSLHTTFSTVTIAFFYPMERYKWWYWMLKCCRKGKDVVVVCDFWFVCW